MFSASVESIGDRLQTGDWPIADRLHKLLSQLADTFAVRRAHIVTGFDRTSLRLVAAWQDGARAPIEDARILDTHCRNVTGVMDYTYMHSSDDLLPSAPFLHPQPVRSFASHPIVSSTGKPIGQICLLHDAQMPDDRSVRTALSLMADRIAAEVEHGLTDEIRSLEISDIQTLLTNLPGMAYRCENGRHRPMNFVSAGCIELTGYSPEELTEGRPNWDDVIHVADRSTVWRRVKRELDKTSRFEVHYRILARDGRCKWVWERGSTVASVDGRRRIEGFITDVTPLREKELQLEQSEAFSKSIVDGVSDGIVLIDKKARVSFLNGAARSLFGVQSEAVTGLTMRKLLAMEHYKLLMSELRQFQATGQAQLFDEGHEMTAVRPDGSTFELHVNMRQVEYGDDGAFAALVRDVTRQKSAEAEIRQQHEQLNATVTFAPFGIAMFDQDQRIVAANPAFADMLGYEVGEVVGLQFMELTHPDDVAQTTVSMRLDRENATDHSSFRTRYLHKDGQVVHAALHVALGYGPEGRAHFGVANVENLTASMSTNAQLKQQQDQIARMDRMSMLGEMTAGIAHEINQPLAAISTYAQSALRFMSANNPRPDRLIEALNKLSEQTQRASAVVERIREFSRQRDTRDERVDCNDLVDTVLGLVDTDARSRGIVVRTELARPLPAVVCDPIQIQQAILHLVRNAIDAMRNGSMGGDDAVVLHTGVVENGDVRISVTDCGVGVSDAVERDLFRPIFASETSGTGMGLSICRSIVAAYGGQIGFHNNASGGATFFLTLPRASGEDDERK